MHSRRSIPTGIVTFLVLVFLLAPLAVVVIFAFHSTPALYLPFEGFSTRWFREILDDPVFRRSFSTSLRVAAIVSALTFFLGTAAAYGVGRSSSRMREALAAIFIFPVALPGVVLGAALLSFFGQRGIPLSLRTVIIAHSVFVLPFFFIVARTAIDRIPEAQVEAAATLGARPGYIFRKVIFPQVLPVLLASTALTFMLSFDETAISIFVVGNESTLPLFIFSRLRRTIDPTVNAASSLLLAVTAVAWLIGLLYGLRTQQRANEQHTSEAGT